MATSNMAVFGMYSLISHHFVGLEFSFYRFLDATWFPLLSDVDREELQHFHENAGEHLG